MSMKQLYELKCKLKKLSVLLCKRKNKEEGITVMIGSGEDVIFVRKKLSERYMLSDGSFLIHDNTSLDDSMYRKPKAFIKKAKKKNR